MRDFGANDNGKIHFSLNPLNRAGAPPRDVRNRVNDVYINDGYTDEDEISYTLPAGYQASRVALNVSLNKPFGKYTATTTVKDGKLIFKRRLQIIDGTYSKDLYPELVEFYQRVFDVDRYGLTLSKEN